VIPWERSSDVQQHLQQLHVARLASQSGLELPPQADWESILAPLRTDFQRQLASPFSFMPNDGHCWGVIWLRTCYDEGTDEAHQKLLNVLNEELALELEENILDDAALYDYGDDWRRIFEVVPERLLEESLRDNHNSQTASEERQAPMREMLRNLDIDEVTTANAWEIEIVRLHLQAARNYLYVSDKVALDTGEVLVVFFDDCGRTVRQSRVQPEFCQEVAGAWFDGCIDEYDAFTEADIGPDYLTGGSCGPPYT
jgi:hypothetical protein